MVTHTNDSVEHRALEALNEAALAIAQEHDVDKVLQQIVDSAMELADAQYAALAVGDWRKRLGERTNVQNFLHRGMTDEDVEAIGRWPEGKGLLGAIIHDHKTIRIPEIAKDERSIGFPDQHPPMTSFLGVPILGAAGEVLGNLYLANKKDANEFGVTDQWLVEMLADHAAVAIQNARLLAQVERLAILEERSRIGMDLHDGVIQSIYAVGLTLETTRLALPEGTEEADALIDRAVQGLNDAIRDIRNFIVDLRPRRFPGDVEKGLAQLIREFQANTMVPATLTIFESMDDMPVTVGRALYLTTQEALANIARHARAESVDVSLTRQNNSVTLKVRDDGRGFNPDNESARIGHGLANMQSRANNLGGEVQIISSPGEGTTIFLRLPR